MNIKKIGLTALAGSLVATSAFAGEMTLSGSATLTYSDWSGTETTTATNAGASSNWGMDQELTASGSGELDNGWVVTLSHLRNFRWSFNNIIYHNRHGRCRYLKIL